MAFVSGKLGDVDGVSLEVDKWVEILDALGHELYMIAGKSSSVPALPPASRQLLLPETRFDSPEQREYERLVFPRLSKRPPRLSGDQRQALLDQLEAHGADVA